MNLGSVAGVVIWIFVLVYILRRDITHGIQKHADNGLDNNRFRRTRYRL